MGNKATQTIKKHHTQVDKAREKKKQKVERRKYTFEFNRAGIKAKVETDRENAIASVLIFLMGLMLIVVGLAYIMGAILYG
tara:strand:+ start:238 stop:480 length:243 start_codon:yes stop_codon:yes gene_type:complete